MLVLVFNKSRGTLALFYLEKKKKRFDLQPAWQKLLTASSFRWFICMIVLPLALAAVQTVLSRRWHRVQQQHKFGIAPSQPLLISIQDAVMQITWWADIDSISILLVLNWAEQPG
jgi:hypothetical protein